MSTQSDGALKMGNKWRACRLGDLFDINPARPLKRGSVTPFIPMGALLPHVRAVERIAAREYIGFGMRFRNGDTLIARITPCLENGKTAFVSGLQDGEVAHGSAEYIVLAGKDGQSDSLFGYYLARTPEFRRYAIAHMEGTSGRQRVPASAIEKYRIALPPLAEQHAIAHILGTLDDKIELNRRMNQTLEAMAQALFQSWFVDFDGVSKKDMQASELGLIPKGWRVGTLGDVTEQLRRSIRPEAIEKNTLYIGLEHMPKRCISLDDWGVADDLGSNKYAFKRGEILFGKLRPYFHKVGIAPIDGVCSTDIVVMVPKSPVWFGFVIFHVASDIFVKYVSSGATGTRMPRTSWPEMARYSLALPPDFMLPAFNQQVHHIAEKIISKSRSPAKTGAACASHKIRFPRCTGPKWVTDRVSAPGKELSHVRHPLLIGSLCSELTRQEVGNSTSLPPPGTVFFRAD